MFLPGTVAKGEPLTVGSRVSGQAPSSKSHWGTLPPRVFSTSLGFVSGIREMGCFSFLSHSPNFFSQSRAWAQVSARSRLDLRGHSEGLLSGGAVP